VLSPTADLTFRPLVGDPRELAEFLGRPGVLRTGHFRLLSGLHTGHFLAFSAIAQDPEAVRAIAADLAAVCGPWGASVVLAPSTAGVALAGELARELGIGLQLAALDANGRASGVLGDIDLSGERVLLVNDVITTGDGLVALHDVVGRAGGSIVGAACFGTRSSVDVAERLGAPVAVSVALQLPGTPEAQCPLCVNDINLEDALDIN
jgi:orotate phosphoribosyltransferase